MKVFGFVPACLCILVLTTLDLHAQVKTETQILRNASARRIQEADTDFRNVLKLAKDRGWQMMINGDHGSIAHLVGVDDMGYPIYLKLDNNITSAATIRTNTLWPGGSTGLSLNGSSASVRGKIGIWDGGKILGSHVELTGRVLQKDNSPSVSSHATHVTGTLIAAGINPAAKGMSFGAQQLLAYDFLGSSDFGEMMAEAPNLLVSNHSYSGVAGWNRNADSSNRWEFSGLPGSTEDYKFGYYSTGSLLFDSIAYNAPFYLIVASAGNSRNENGPAVGQPYWRPNAQGVMTPQGARPDGISSNDGYDIITDRSVAKNVLTVGSIGAIPGGLSFATDAVLSPFSAIGPTDDGRIKPDVVADGESILSTSGSGDNNYEIQSGTSMSAPAVTGSLYLLQEYYNKLHPGTFMRSATLKGLAIHTADDAGNPGPDYQYGWGVVNMEKAAAVITANNSTHLIQENNLTNGANFTTNVVSSGQSPLRVTISWTDPKGTVESGAPLNSRTKKLVNDLDIRVTKGGNTFLPFVLNVANPSAAATRGDNTTDNVEQIIIDNTAPGETYTITVTHKGTLQRGAQAYSLIVSGVGGSAYCSSAPTTNAGARIDSVALGNTGIGNASGCTTYSNKTSTSLSMEPGQTIPYFVRVSSCDATSVAKMVKIFIDYNNDGDFADSGELVATSPVINGTGNFTGTFVTPGTLVKNTSLLMRVIVQETSTASDINACGTYSRGETEDFSVKISGASNDVGVADIISPTPSSCGNTAQYVTVKLTNFGSTARFNFPVTYVVRNGATTVATINAVYPDTLQPQASKVYTFPGSFNAQPGNTYSLAASTNLTNDQFAGNNTVTITLAVTSVGAPPAATANICGTTAVLQSTATGSNIVNWYNSATSTTPIASGFSTTTTTIPANNTFYMSVNEVPGKAGLTGAAGKAAVGGYSSLSALMNFTNNVPLTIDNVRFYVGSPGKIKVIVADNVTTNASGGFSYVETASATLDVYKTGANLASDTGGIFSLNLPVNATGNHSLFIEFSNGATIYRNNGLTATPYPVALPGIFSFTGNNQTNQAAFYYYFYDMSIRLANCPSTRVPVVATTNATPVVTMAGNLLTSSIAAGNQWYLNGTAIPGATAQTFTATTAGIYKTVISSAACGSVSSNEVNFGATPVVDINGTQIALIASPNPNKGEFFLQFEVKGKDDLNISMLNELGQRVYSQNYPAFTGRFAQQIKPTGKVLPGLYILKIEHNKKTYIKKILVQE